MEKVDLILRNVMYLDCKKREFFKGDIAVKDGKVIAINGEYEGIEEKDLNGKFIVPGFIDGHIHLESSVISPEDFAKIAAIHGTTAVVTDPHEIANVCGIDGIRYMLQKTKNLPIDINFMIPSCVPATDFDESAFTLNANDTSKCFDLEEAEGRVKGLAEMMNFPGVLFGDSNVLAKIEEAKKRGKRVDGHAPGLTGTDLEKYISTGIESDHECSTLDEAIEKIETAKKVGQKFYIMIREGTAAKNLKALAPLISMHEYRENIMFATDDKHPEELMEEGHIDAIVKKAIELGVKPEEAYATATYNAAEYFGLNDLGNIEVGKEASFSVIADLDKVQIEEVYKKGEKLTIDKLKNWATNVVEEGLEDRVRNSINMDQVKVEDIECKGLPKQVIGLIPGEIITTEAGATCDYDIKNDIVKVAVIESHKGTMNTGIAYLKGMGLKKGAVGTTVAHDSHYMIAAGTNDRDIVKALNRMREMQGGKVYVEDGEVMEELALPIANLMTDENPKEVVKKMNKLKEMAKVNDGIDAFMNLSFVSLPVIGDVRLLPGGAFDTKKWGFVTEEELKKKIKNKEKKIGIYR